MGKEDEMGGRMDLGGHMDIGGRMDVGGRMDIGKDGPEAVSSPQAGIIVRATVESLGPAGDTELSITVKWPAGSISAQRMDASQRGLSDAQQDSGSDGALQAKINRRPPPV